MSNPLLKSSELPKFSAIKAEHVEPAIDAILAENRGYIEQLLASKPNPDWASVIEPMEEWDDRLERAWSPVAHMNSVVNSDELRAAYNACLPKLSDYATEMGHNEALYQAYRAVAEHDDSLDAAQQKVLENALRDFHLSGVDLPPEKKTRYKEISQELSSLTSRFEENVLDATHDWSKRIEDAAALAGLPESAIELARQTAEQRELPGYVLTLDFPSYYPVMTYADDRGLRRELYEAYSTRASDQGPAAGEFDNTEVMDRILALRHEKAQLLGFANYAELSLAPKMARSTDEVVHFLEDLAVKSRDQGERDLQQVRQYAKGDVRRRRARTLGYPLLQRKAAPSQLQHLPGGVEALFSRHSR